MIFMTRLPLPQVTLCAVDTRTPALAALSLQCSMNAIDFGRVVLFTNHWTPPQALPGVELVQISTLQSGADYSRFVLRELPAHVRTSHVLVTQWDGFVLDAGAWRSDFLLHDYVGAVWPDAPAGQEVGNGGFSLRSRRLLSAGLDPRIAPHHPEDQALCRDHRSLLEREHGVRFAPAALARCFSFENEPPGHPTFGFHGPYNLPRVFDERRMVEVVEHLPDEFFRSRDARRLARALLVQRMPAVAQRLLQRRRAAGRVDPHTRLLGVWASLQGLASPRAR